MNALLHYNILKSWRDRSLLSFILVPVLVPVAALFGGTFSKGLHYPLFMEPRFSVAQNAALVGEIASVMCSLFVVVPAFWTLRTEIASKSVSCFAMVTRPIKIVAMLVLYSACLGYCAWLIAISSIGLLTTALPAHLAFIAFKVAVAVFGTSALGALAVTISPQPAMIVAAYFAAVIVVPLFAKTTTTATQLVAIVVGALISIAIATILLERRCAR